VSWSCNRWRLRLRQYHTGRRVAEERPKTFGPVIIKKYANRRLYDTRTSAYVTLDHLSEMVKQGVAFEVHDARTNEDITRSVLLQIISEEESRGQNLLSIRFLRMLIRFYGDSMQLFVPGYLDLAMDNLSRNRETMRERLTEALGGNPQALEHESRRSQKLMEKAAELMQPFDAPGQSNDNYVDASKVQSARSAAEISQLKNEIEEMRKLIGQLSGQS
jgi:polyhydroxyalkanoate synthesis repressor PhaR